MAFLAEDEDAMRAFEAALSFLDDFAEDDSASGVGELDNPTEAPPPVVNGLEIPSNGAPNHESDANSAGAVVTVGKLRNDSASGRRGRESETPRSRQCQEEDAAEGWSLRRPQPRSQRTEARDCVLTRKGGATGNGVAESTEAIEPDNFCNNDSSKRERSGWRRRRTHLYEFQGSSSFKYLGGLCRSSEGPKREGRAGKCATEARFGRPNQSGQELRKFTAEARPATD
ncbi:hypothetical protein ON010_g17742 [Phytophthora cinnamomi]|nr:hypothetical protein ON010_g17742 [Phytophthora cinnamomi]